MFPNKTDNSCRYIDVVIVGAGSLGYPVLMSLARTLLSKLPLLNNLLGLAVVLGLVASSLLCHGNQNSSLLHAINVIYCFIN